MESVTVELLGFFKALSDVNRLKIVGLLSQGEYSVEQLSAILDLRPSTISHHLSRLARAELVSARADGYYSVYRLQPQTIEHMARRLLSTEDLPAVAADLDLNAFNRKVMRDFSKSDGSLKTIPSQRKKLEVVLQHIVKSFEPDRRYSEQQVNTILRQFHEDTATLRRELVGARLLGRQAGQYWRPQPDAE